MLIHAQVFVEYMLHALCRTISQFVGVILDTKEMHLLHVVVLQRVSFKIQKKVYFFIKGMIYVYMFVLF